MWRFQSRESLCSSSSFVLSSSSSVLFMRVEASQCATELRLRDYHTPSPERKKRARRSRRLSARHSFEQTVFQSVENWLACSRCCCTQPHCLVEWPGCGHVVCHSCVSWVYGQTLQLTVDSTRCAIKISLSAVTCLRCRRHPVGFPLESQPRALPTAVCALGLHLRRAQSQPDLEHEQIESVTQQARQLAQQHSEKLTCPLCCAPLRSAKSLRGKGNLPHLRDVVWRHVQKDCTFSVLCFEPSCLGQDAVALPQWLAHRQSHGHDVQEWLMDEIVFTGLRAS
jgi:hypothetical protein